MSKITLPDDPKEALEQIAGYLRTLSTDPARAVREEGDEEFVGYWQCPEWFDGLIEIADECDRLVSATNAPAAALKQPTSVGWWFVRHPEGWPDGCVARVYSVGEYGKAVIWGHSGTTLKIIDSQGWEWLRPLDIPFSETK